MRHRSPAWSWAVGALLSAAMVSGAASATAGPAAGVGILVHTPLVGLAPGQSTTGTAEIANATKETVHLKLFPGVGVELPAGGYRLDGGMPTKNWIRLSTYSLVIAANRVKLLSYRITVPARTPAGYYLLGIVSQFASHKVHGHSGKVGIVVNINMQNTAPIVVHVPGPTTFGARLSGWSVSWLGHAGYQLQTTVENTGNAYENVRARLLLINGSKRTGLAPLQTFLLRHASATLTFVAPSVDVGPNTVAVVTVAAPHHNATVSGHLRLAKVRGHKK